MQITSKNGCMVIDYYPVMTPTKKLLANYRLRVLTFIGQTQNKELISEKEMITDRELLIKDGSFKVSCQTNLPPQYMTFTEVK